MKAYHFVSGGIDVLRNIVTKGRLYPASARLESCEELWAIYEDGMDSFRMSKTFSKKYVAAMDRIARAVIRCPRPADLEPLPNPSHFRLEEILSRDVDLIFFQLGDWPWHLMEDEFGRELKKPTGFVFDGKTLVTTLGGRVRIGDVLENYEVFLGELYGRHPRTVADAEADIESGFKALKNQVEVPRRMSVDALSGNTLKYGGELVVPKPIPVSLAIEVWVDGRKVR